LGSRQAGLRLRSKPPGIPITGVEVEGGETVGFEPIPDISVGEAGLGTEPKQGR
jgi:hypothetical protein